MGLRARLGENGVAMAAHYAISPAEDDAVIRQRLLTRTTTTRGEPPLKKLIKKFTALAGEIDKEDSKYSECEKLYKSFLQELATFELPLLKTKAVVDANRREQESFKELHVELNQQISQVSLFSMFSEELRRCRSNRGRFACFVLYWLSCGSYFLDDWFHGLWAAILRLFCPVHVFRFSEAFLLAHDFTIDR